MIEEYKTILTAPDLLRAMKAQAALKGISLQDYHEEILREAMGMSKPEPEREEEGISYDI